MTSIILAPQSIYDLAKKIGLTPGDLKLAPLLKPYVILDGHRTGKAKNDGVNGYAEGAAYSLTLAKTLQDLGVKDVAFLIHTQRNRKNPERMKKIFDGIKAVSDEFIQKAHQLNMRLKYYGENVHTTYELAPLILEAEYLTQQNDGITIHFMTNYSEQWVIRNYHEIAELPQFNVIARHTKGHVSGAWIPGKLDKANFVYIQNASIVQNWGEVQLELLALFMLKSFLSMNGFIGNKVYSESEREFIYHAREEELMHQEYMVKTDGPSKLLQTFDATGPIILRI